MDEIKKTDKKNWGIFKKILFSFLFFSILPLIIFALITAFLFRDSNEQILKDTRLLVDRNIEKNLMIQAKQISRKVEAFLRNREFDLLELSKTEITPNSLLQFAQTKSAQIWIRSHEPEDSIGVWKFIPLYKEIEFVDNYGNQKIKILDGKPVPAWQRGNIKNPINTTYFSEDYFNKSQNLKEGEVFVSHLHGFFVPKEEYQHDPMVQYNGVIRFVTPVFRNGKKEGTLVLGLDHKHLMEFTQHVLPNSPEETIFPDYDSGDYAFMFDDEGWIITHPKIWDIRGVDGTGKLVHAYTEKTSKENIERGFIPFNLDSAAFIHPNYPVVLTEVRRKKSGKVITVNVGGTKKLNVYAPILYDKGVYSKYGIFGGISVGIESQNFVSTSSEIEYLIRTTFNKYFDNIVYVIFGSILFSFIVSFFFSRNITKPIITLTEFSQKLASGKLDKRIELNRNDEIALLASSLNQMANELEKGRNQLLNSNAELENSKAHIQNYAIDLEYQLNVLKSIQSISNTIGLTYDLNTILKTILKTTVESINFSRTILYLIDDEKKFLKYHDACGFNEAEFEKAKNFRVEISAGNSVESYVLKSGKILFVDDYKEYNKKNNLVLLTSFFAESNSFVFIPLFVQEKIIGILGADKLDSKNKISVNDINSFQILANQASRAIENSRLYSEIIAQRNFVNDIISNMMNGVVSTNGSGIITSINKAAREILELPQEELIGKNIWEVLSQREELKNEMLKSLNNTGMYKAYEKELMLNGKKKFLNINASRVYRNGVHTSSILIVEDVTDKKILDEELKKIDRLVSLGRFAAGIAHEIRNPLTGLSLFLDNLHDHISISDPANSKLISNALNEIERLDNLVNEILDYAVPSKNRMQNANINSIIESLLLLLSQQLKKSKVEVEKNFEESIPNFAFDTERIKQALLNIILNSLQFMPDGGKLIIETKFANRKDVMIIITDTGKGFDEKEIENIFDPFYSRRQEGIGLGLAITHAIITEHNGTIIAKNSEKFGAEFKIKIPIKRTI